MRYKLKQVCDFYSGTGFPVVYQGEESGDLPFYKVGDIAANVAAGNDCLSFCNNYISYDVAKEIKGSILPKDVVVFAKIGEALKLNRRAITSCNCLIDNNAMGIAAKPSVLDVRYFFYFMKSVKMEEHSESTTVPSVRKSKLENIEITVPDMQDQQQIAAILDKLQSIITHRKQQLEKLDELVKARFVEMFMGKDYPTMTLDSLSLSKGEYGAQSAAIEYDAARPRYVRITDINDDGTLNNDVVSSSNPDDDIQYKLSYGDFLFARMGATVGKTYAYKSGNQIYAGYLIRYRLDLERILPDYLYSYTRLNAYWEWVKLNQSGAAQPGINAKKYGSLLIPVAPMAEQKAFSAFVEQTDKSKVAVQKALDEAQLLFDSLMQEYFG